MTVTALNCPVCSGPMKMGVDRCDYCGSTVVIKTDMVRIDPNTLNQGVIHQHIAEFRNRVHTNPNDASAHYGLGIAFYNLGLTEVAVGSLETASSLMPENPNILISLAEMYLVHVQRSFADTQAHAAQTVLDRAMTTLGKAQILGTIDHRLGLLKAKVLLSSGKSKDALDVLRTVSGDRSASRSVIDLVKPSFRFLDEFDQWFLVVALSSRKDPDILKKRSGRFGFASSPGTLDGLNLSGRDQAMIFYFQKKGDFFKKGKIWANGFPVCQPTITEAITHDNSSVILDYVEYMVDGSLFVDYFGFSREQPCDHYRIVFNHLETLTRWTMFFPARERETGLSQNQLAGLKNADFPFMLPGKYSIAEASILVRATREFASPAEVICRSE